MKTKNIYKIGLSLLIALCFIIPTGMSMSDQSEESEAGNFSMSDTFAVKLGDVISQAAGDVSIGTAPPAILENPDGDLIELIDGITIPIEDYYNIYIVLDKVPNQLTTTVKPHLELYCVSEGERVEMYYTSFEDNFDIYNNWIQIDADCAIVGGHYDSFSWSDDRAFCEDHSFKSTMYDIYKGNQDDYFELRKTFDISDQYAVEVEFYIWVEGQGDDGAEPYDPFDYLSFEIGSDGNWVTNLTLNDAPGDEYKFFDTTLPPYDPDHDLTKTGPYDYRYVEDAGNGWWKVVFRVNTSELHLLDAGYPFSLDPTNLSFRFDWHTDPQFQYEGAYVDCFRVTSIENVITKVFQTHSQGPIEINDDCETFFKFPLAWEDVDECECYLMKLWVEVVSNGQSLNDWPDTVDIEFCVGDELDCEIWDLIVEDSFTEQIVEDGGFMTAGSDAHFIYTFHANGTIPSVNVEIVGSINKLEWVDAYTDDFEGMAWSDSGAFDGPNLWHKTSADSWSGSSALGCFNKDTNHYENDMYLNYVLSPKMLDMTGVKEMYLDYYTKFITEGLNDYWAILLFDPATNYVLGNIGAIGYNTYGYQPDWIGPMQPMGKWQPFDLKDAYDYWYEERGMFRNPDGTQSYDMGFGLAIWGTDAYGYTNAQAEANGDYWSGWFYDDFVVRSLQVGENVFRETHIIPGPLEPCETAELQFEWEDVTYSRYEICVEAICEGDVDLDDNKLCQEILVMDPLENMVDKDVESLDLTGLGEGEWAICGSDYDNYLSTNADSTEYVDDANAIVMLCPDHGGDCDLEEGDPCCINISHLNTADVAITPLSEDFSGGIPAGWTGASEWPTFGSNLAGGTAPEIRLRDGTMTAPASLTFTTDTSDGDTLDFEFKSYIRHDAGDFRCRVRIRADPSDSWSDITPWTNNVAGDIAAATYNIDISDYAGTSMQIQFRIDQYSGIDDINRWCLDDFIITGTDDYELEVEFDAWWDLESGWDYVYLEVSDGCPADLYYDWIEVKNWTGFSGDEATADGDDWVHEIVDIWPPITGTEFSLRFRFVSDESGHQRGMLIDDMFIEDLFDITKITDPMPVFANFSDPMNDMDNWCTAILHYGQYWEYDGTKWCADIPDLPVEDALIWSTEILDAYEAYLTVNHSRIFQNKLSLLLEDFDSAIWSPRIYHPGHQMPADWSLAGAVGVAIADSWGYPAVVWGWGGAWTNAHVFNVTMPSPMMDMSTLPDPTATVQFFTNSFKVFDNYTIDIYSAGTYEETIAEIGSGIGQTATTISENFIPADYTDPSQIQVALTYDTNGLVDQGWAMANNLEVFSQTLSILGYLEISIDGENWFILDVFYGNDPWAEETYDITPWAGNEIFIRFRYEGNTKSTGQWCINWAEIKGKKDTSAPTTTATMSGTMTDAGWYSSAVQIQITAVDDTGMGEIHYILDGVETVVAGDSASFSVTGNGAHNVEFWGVDAMGNEELPHNVIPTFRIDAGAPPTVAITAPQPGLYLFGNQILSLSKVFIIGAFDIEATASDAESGVYRVQFFLDNDLISEDTEAPFSAYCAEKHMGEGTIKVIAEDFSGNTAEDTLDITYYKFL
jgi:hypothetical protein